MLTKVSEKKLHIVRWLLAVGWLTLIFSLLYDPISPWFTDPSNLSSPFHLHPEINLDPEKCVKVQGVCLPQQPYGMGPRIFWGMVLPIGILTLLVFGHESWRRICPLYFFSQIPRALGIQRKRKVANPSTGSIRYELAGIDKESWLGRNYLYLQFGLFYVGLNIMLLFANGDRLAMAVFLLFTISSAIIVGFLFKGRSWCQYFCPMAPVQMFYTGPRGLLGSDAHLSQPQSITQSMCRTIDSSGQEKSACVSCQSPCIDIDAERSYWEGITRADQKLVFYGYFGLMLGYYFFFFLYAGNWNYYYSGAWTHEGLIGTFLNPGFYLFNHPIHIPKLIAAPLTLAFFVAASYFICLTLEKAFRAYLKQKNKSLSNEQTLHICFVLCTFISFNVYFIFAGRPNINLLPNWAVLVFNGFIVLVSSLWLYRSLGRSKELYSRESLANSLRRQLNKLTIDWSKFLEGRSLQDLIPDEVYVLAKVLPGFSRADRLKVYKGVLQEALEDGEVHSANSLEVLKDIRKELSIGDKEHYAVLTELGIEDPSLLDPQKQLTRENRLRVEGYRRALELLLLELVESGKSLQEATKRKQNQIMALRQEYAITADEQEQVLAEMFNEDGALLHTAEVLLAQLQDLAVCCQALSKLVPNPQAPVYVLLRSTVQQKQQLIATQLLSIIEILGDSPEARNIASSIAILAAKIVQEMLQSNDEQSKWQERLSPRVITLLQQAEGSSTLPNLPRTKTGLESLTHLVQSTSLGSSGNSAQTDLSVLRPEAIIDVLSELLQDLDPLVQAASLYALHQLEPSLGSEHAHQLMNSNQSIDWLLRETAENILGQGKSQEISADVPILIVQLRAMGRTERLIFQQPVIRVGRSHENEIVISDNRVSREHAIFYLDEQGVSVKDLGSTNGLRIGSEPIHDQQKQLSQGDIVRFSTGDELAMLVHWKMQPVQADPSTEALGTLEKLLWLYESSFFRGLKANALIELAWNTQVRVYCRGEEICKMGKPVDELLVLIDGEAKVCSAIEGRDQIIETVSPGQTIGELGVLTHMNRAATVIATGERTRTLVINAKNFESVLRQDPLLARNLLVMVSTRLQETLSQGSPVALS